MRIGIDCRLAGIEHAGIGRYIEELVREVTKDETIEWVLFFQCSNQLPWLKASGGIKLVISPVRHYTLAEQIKMPGIFAREHLDLLHVPHFNVPLLYRGKFVVTIHDLLWHDQRGSSMTTLSPLMYAAKYRAYRYVASSAVRRSEAVFVPAETIKQTVLTHVPGVDTDKIHVTYEGVDEKWFTSKGQEARVKGQEKILFYTGSLYPHKNVMVVVRALKLLPDYHLYISSSRDIFVTNFLKEVSRESLKDRVTHLGRLEDRELQSWYQKSFALVQPSLSEGFGLTGVEAMATGLPVLASDIPIFREVYKNACTYFDPVYPESFGDAVAKLEAKDRGKVAARGIEIARGYSWQKMGEQTLHIYKKIPLKLV